MRAMRVVQAMVPQDQQRRIDAEAPAAIALPTGTRAAIDYAREPPIIRARIQVCVHVCFVVCSCVCVCQIEMLQLAVPGGRPFHTPYALQITLWDICRSPSGTFAAHPLEHLQLTL